MKNPADAGFFICYLTMNTEEEYNANANPGYNHEEVTMLEYQLENRFTELKGFLTTIVCVKKFYESKTGGPVQEVPKSSTDYQIGCRILLPLPWGKAILANQIMSSVEEWAKERGLERFGYVAPGDCPLLLIGLRELSVAQ